MNSTYYYNLMQQIQSSKKKIMDKKLEYEIFLNKLKSLKATLVPLPNEFLNAENCYENGGYFAAGETLSRGMLKNKASDLDDSISSIASFIMAIETKINNYSYQIRKLNSDYSEAARNYQKAMIESGSK